MVSDIELQALRNIGNESEDAANEIENLRALIAELLDTELGELACAGSDAPVEDVLGRMKIAIGA